MTLRWIAFNLTLQGRRSRVTPIFSDLMYKKSKKFSFLSHVEPRNLPRCPKPEERWWVFWRSKTWGWGVMGWLTCSQVTIGSGGPESCLLRNAMKSVYFKRYKYFNFLNIAITKWRLGCFYYLIFFKFCHVCHFKGFRKLRLGSRIA